MTGSPRLERSSRGWTWWRGSTAMALSRGAEYFDVEFPELDRIGQATIPSP